MSDASNIIEGKIAAGKQALSNNYIDIAIQAFQEALNVANPEGSSQNSLIGIAQAYLLLASGIKGEKDDKNTVPQITEALDLLPAETHQIKIFISLLMDIGKELLRINFFESSGIVYRKALRYAQIQGAEGDIATISGISWNLGFSYQKTGKIESAAKLYKIAADLEQRPEDALTLYRSSAFHYYQSGKKDEALNTFQTAFDKAGVLKQNDVQNEIATFQGRIAFEIYKTRKTGDPSSQNLQYLDLALEKFKFSNDLEWIERIKKIQDLLSKLKSPESDSTITIQPKVITTRNHSSVDAPVQDTPIEGSSDDMALPTIGGPSNVSRSMRGFLDDSTRTLENFAKISSEDAEPDEEIEELHHADIALSEGSLTKLKTQSIDSYDRLFPTSEKTIHEEESITAEALSGSSNDSTIEQLSPVGDISKFSEVSSRLQQAGWIIQANNISSNTKNPEPDILAEKGMVRKQRKMIFFAEDVADAEICSFLLQSNQTPGEKYVFLLSGNPSKAKISPKVKLVTRVDQIF